MNLLLIKGIIVLIDMSTSTTTTLMAILVAFKIDNVSRVFVKQNASFVQVWYTWDPTHDHLLPSS